MARAQRRVRDTHAIVEWLLLFAYSFILLQNKDSFRSSKEQTVATPARKEFYLFTVPPEVWFEAERQAGRNFAEVEPGFISRDANGRQWITIFFRSAGVVRNEKQAGNQQ